jgi:hypothetical protein
MARYYKRQTYRQDPYWLYARFNSVCSCGAKIATGDHIFYYPPFRNEKGKAYCESCGQRGQSDLNDEKLNEQFHIR